MLMVNHRVAAKTSTVMSTGYLINGPIGEVYGSSQNPRAACTHGHFHNLSFGGSLLTVIGKISGITRLAVVTAAKYKRTDVAVASNNSKSFRLCVLLYSRLQHSC